MGIDTPWALSPLSHEDFSQDSSSYEGSTATKSKIHALTKVLLDGSGLEVTLSYGALQIRRGLIWKQSQSITMICGRDENVSHFSSVLGKV